MQSTDQDEVGPSSSNPASSRESLSEWLQLSGRPQSRARVEIPSGAKVAERIVMLSH